MPSKNLCHNLSVCSGFVNFATSKSGGSCRRRQGEMVEWSITPVLKTGIRRRIGGSNPSLSAKKRRNKLIINELRRFFIEWLIKICATFQLEVQQTPLPR